MGPLCGSGFITQLIYAQNENSEALTYYILAEDGENILDETGELIQTES